MSVRLLSRIALSLSLLVTAVTIGACTNAKLSKVPEPSTIEDNKLAVSGEFCTTDPDELKFPVKLLFIIDTSTSMRVTDPDESRVDAILRVIDSLEGQNDVEFGIITFGLGAVIATEKCDDYETREGCRPGFTSDFASAVSSATQAGLSNGTTDYIIALQTAVSMLATDMSEGLEEDLENSRYSVIFLSDGIPDSDGRFNVDQTCEDARDWIQSGRPGDRGLTAEIATLIDQMADVADRFRIRELTFNGAFVASPTVDPEIRGCSGNLIRAMSEHGEGAFRDFSSGEGINFLFVDFTSFKRIFNLSNLTVSNLNARPFSEALYLDVDVTSDDPRLDEGIADSDGDGLTDQLEDLIGSSPFLQDSDGDGFSDLLEHRLRNSGFDTLDPTDADCPAAIDRIDTDRDGLRDCEERFAGTSTGRYDSDRDGFGDGLEFLYGTNPGLADGLLDVDFDGADNAREIRWHSRPTQDDIAFLSQHAYRYQVIENGIVDSRTCYRFDVSNITLASTQGAMPPLDEGVAPGLGGGALEVGENRIILEVSEAPFDAPEETRVTKVACVAARYSQSLRVKLPANGQLEVPPAAFIDADAFDPQLHCITP